MGYRMKGFSGFGNEDKRILRKSNKKLIKEQRERFKSGETTRKQFREAKKEIRGYTDVDVAKEHLEKSSPGKSWDTVKKVGKKVYEKAKSKVTGKVVAKGLKKAGAKTAARLVPGVGQAVMLAEGTKAVFDGYGKMGKTKEGRQMIKDSGLGRTRKI